MNPIDVVDLSLINLGAPPRDLRRAPLGHVAFVGIARRKHPMFATKRPQPHRERFVIASSSGRTEGPLDGALAVRGRRRRVVAAVPMYTAVPSLVAQTDLVAYAPEPLARRAPERNKLRTFRAPRALVRQPVDLVWHEHSHTDPCPASFAIASRRCRRPSGLRDQSVRKVRTRHGA